VANDAAPGPGFAKYPAAAAPRGIGVNRRVSLNTAYTTAHDDEFVYCGPERYKNGGMAQQLQAPKLWNSKFPSRRRRRKVA
jgi:hypothetical protein